MAKSKQLKKLSPIHHAIIDWLIANPRRTGIECAKAFDCSPIWISILKNSPVFEEELQRRQTRISQSLDQRVEGLTSASLDQLQSRLDNESGSLSVRELLQMVSTASRVAGLGR